MEARDYFDFNSTCSHTAIPSAFYFSLPCLLANLMITDKLYMLLVAASLDGSTSAIMASWNRKTRSTRVSKNSLFNISRMSPRVASLGNSTKPIFVKGFLPSPSATVLRTFTGSLTVYDSSVVKKNWHSSKRIINKRAPRTSTI